jgi:hypothetical protein
VKSDDGVDVKSDEPPVHSISVINHNLTRNDLFRDGEIYPIKGLSIFCLPPRPGKYSGRAADQIG